jgi:hypothetical protein
MVLYQLQTISSKFDEMLGRKEHALLGTIVVVRAFPATIRPTLKGVKEVLVILHSVESIGILIDKPIGVFGVLGGRVNLVGTNDGGRILIVGDPTRLKFHEEVGSVVVVKSGSTSTIEEITIEVGIESGKNALLTRSPKGIITLEGWHVSLMLDKKNVCELYRGEEATTFSVIRTE